MKKGHKNLVFLLVLFFALTSIAFADNMETEVPERNLYENYTSKEYDIPNGTVTIRDKDGTRVEKIPEEELKDLKMVETSDGRYITLREFEAENNISNNNKNIKNKISSSFFMIVGLIVCLIIIFIYNSNKTRK